jgi:hypothetical protein
MPDPTSVAPSNRRTNEPASAVPENVGVESDVTSSVFDVPVSLPASRSGVDGADGADASIVTTRPALERDVFSSASVAVAVIVCPVSPRTDTVME